MPVQLSGSAVFTLLVTLFLLFMVLNAVNLRYGAWKFPIVVGVPSLALAIFQLCRELRGREKKGRVFDVAPDKSIPPKLAYKRAAKFLFWILGLYAAIWLIGFKIGFLLFFVLFLKVEGRRGWLMTAILTALVVFIILVQYEHLFGVHWPEGVLESYIKLPF